MPPMLNLWLLQLGWGASPATNLYILMHPNAFSSKDRSPCVTICQGVFKINRDEINQARSRFIPITMHPAIS